MNIGPLIRSPEELHSALAVSNHLGGIEENRAEENRAEENRAQFLELRTESGAVYLCPSRWQRIRLLWTFRHFHVLPRQVLSRRDQRLIETLSRSARVTPALPIASDTVFGVVEEVASQSTASAGRVVTVSTDLIADIPDLPFPDFPDYERLFFEESGPEYFPAANSSGSIRARGAVAAKYAARDGGEGGMRDARFQQWGALGMLIAVGIVVILARVYDISLFPTAAQIRNPQTVSRPMEKATNRIKPQDLHPLAANPAQVSPSTVSLPRVENPKHPLARLAPEPTLVDRKSSPPASGSGGRSMIDSGSAATPIDPTAIARSGGSERLFVAELPQGHFAEPVVSDPNLVGELHLRAVIGADGSVKGVTVLSGNPKLAEAGMRAVRHWHYSQYQALGRAGEGETLIRMSFFGQDAVSITSVAK